MSIIWIPRPLHTQTHTHTHTHTHTQTLGSYLENKICLRHGNNAKTKEWTIGAMSKLTFRKTSNPLRIHLAIKTRMFKENPSLVLTFRTSNFMEKTTQKIYWGNSKRFLNLNFAKNFTKHWHYRLRRLWARAFKTPLYWCINIWTVSSLLCLQRIFTASSSLPYCKCDSTARI